MLIWWNELSLTSQIFTAFAVPATIIMVLQSILLLFGLGFDHDSDFSGLHHDFGGHDGHGANDGGGDGGDGLALFTVRGIVAFFSVGGWAGLVCSTGGIPTGGAAVIAFLAGSAALVGIAYLFKYSFKLQDKGNLDIRNAIGKTGTVYIPIPKSREGQGKVTLMAQERLLELDAVTDENHVLHTNEIVLVKDIIGEQTVLVTATQTNEPTTINKNETGGISKWITR